MSARKTVINPKATIHPSEFHGKGLFAVSSITQGEEIIRWGGEYVKRKKAEKARKAGKLVMQWDDDLYSIEERGDDDGYYINHSCNPNMGMKDAYTLVALRKIQAGEELTADYAMWEADPDYKSAWTCRCGESNCRGIVTGNDWKLAELQQKYGKHFSPLINKRTQRSLDIYRKPSFKAE